MLGRALKMYADLNRKEGKLGRMKRMTTGSNETPLTILYNHQ